MGVLQCDRNGCTENMCGRYSDVYGYICDECYEELINTGIRMEPDRFMESKKHSTDYKDAVTEKCNEIFKEL